MGKAMTTSYPFTTTLGIYIYGSSEEIYTLFSTLGTAKSLKLM